jgi:hypothetical protein
MRQDQLQLARSGSHISIPMPSEVDGATAGPGLPSRLMRINGIKPVRTRKHKGMTNSDHLLGVAANWLDGNFAGNEPNRKWLT